MNVFSSAQEASGAAGPCASTTPSPKCAPACGSTHQVTSPGARVPPYRAEIVRGISGGAAVKYADGDIRPALPETMTLRGRRPFPMRSPISDPQEIMAGYPSSYEIMPHPS